MKPFGACLPRGAISWGRHAYSADFIGKANLSSAPTAERAIEKLVALGILCWHKSECGKFKPFLIEWLKRHQALTRLAGADGGLSAPLRRCVSLLEKRDKMSRF